MAPVRVAVLNVYSVPLLTTTALNVTHLAHTSIYTTMIVLLLVHSYITHHSLMGYANCVLL